MNNPDFWAALNPSTWPLLGLITARIGGMMLAVPFFNILSFSPRVRAALTVSYAIVLTPLVQSPFPMQSAGQLPGMLVVEIFYGFCIGIVAAIFFAGIALAGEVIAIQTGLSAASVLSPGSDISLPVVGNFVHLFCVVVWCIINGHLTMLRALGESFTQIPLGQLPEMDQGLLGIVLLGKVIFTTGVQVAAPVIAALLVANVILGVLARTAPQMNLLISSFPLTIALGLLVISASLPFLATYVVQWNAELPGLIAELLATLVRK